MRQQNKRYPNGFNGHGGRDLSQLAVTPPGEQFSVVMFDGVPFRAPQDIQVVPYLEMAYRARRGDESAALTLTTFGIVLLDATKRQYWPVEPQEQIAAIIESSEAPSPILLSPGVV